MRSFLEQSTAVARCQASSLLRGGSFSPQSARPNLTELQDGRSCLIRRHIGGAIDLSVGTRCRGSWCGGLSRTVGLGDEQ